MAKAECGKCGCACKCGKKPQRKRRARKARGNIPLAQAFPSMHPLMIPTAHRGITSQWPIPREALAQATEAAIRRPVAARAEAGVGTEAPARVDAGTGPEAPPREIAPRRVHFDAALDLIPVATSRGTATTELEAAEQARAAAERAEERERHRQTLRAAQEAVAAERAMARGRVSAAEAQVELERAHRAEEAGIYQEELAATRAKTIPVGKERTPTTLPQLEQLVREGFTIQARRSKYMPRGMAAAVAAAAGGGGAETDDE